MDLPLDHREKLDHDGYVVLSDCIPSNLLDELRQRVDELFQLEGDSAGAEFKQELGSRRLANLVNKGSVFQQVIASAEILPYVRYVLGPQIKLIAIH